MSYSSKPSPVIERLDALAEATGIPAISRAADNNRRNHKPRRQILFPALMMVASAACFVATLNHHSIVGALSVFPFLGAMVAKQYGPVRLFDATAPYDEREQIIIWRSRCWSLSLALALAVAGGLAYAITDALVDGLRLSSNVALSATWLLVTVATAATTIAASVMLPSYELGDDA